MGPGENDRFEGKDALLASWKENAEMMPMIEWSEPYMDGEIGVRCGKLGDWKFECRVKTKDNLLLECVTKTEKTVSIPELQKEFLSK